jgi:sRNA-binding protein
VPRIDLEGNVAGEVTTTDQADAKRKIAKEAARAAAKAIEDRNRQAGPRLDLARNAPDNKTRSPTQNLKPDTTSRVGWPQGGRTGSPGETRRRKRRASRRKPGPIFRGRRGRCA